MLFVSKNTESTFISSLSMREKCSLRIFFFSLRIFNWSFHRPQSGNYVGHII